ncbi:hypothetical protein GCM10022224_063700 [Nonomuraea antimicrobica]|uniref:Ricin B lectin domain-containing protein n=1 Tax=Nonomuraea antimicrobica TaxID=561173 RepID=A0ABP7CIF5_9ACTN
MANGYFANDLVQSQEAGDARQTWTLDPLHRSRTSRAQTQVDGTWTNTAAKVNHYGDDSDEPTWIAEDDTGARTRIIAGPDNDLVATSSANGSVLLQLTNLHGDVAATVDRALSEPELFDYQEFGEPAGGQSGQRYGWLSGKLRSGEAMGGTGQERPQLRGGVRHHVLQRLGQLVECQGLSRGGQDAGMGGRIHLRLSA